MSRYYQVPHHATGWLLLGALWAVLPILWRGPVTLLIVVLLLLGWRWQIARARLSMPGRLLRLGLLLLLVLLTLWHYRTIFGPEAGVALLASTFTLKLLEMFRLRDAYVALLLGFFVLAMNFLFQQGPLITFYVLVGFVLFAAALIGINQADEKGRALAHLRVSGLLVAKALPLMLVIFVVVPRVAPLWGFSLNTDQARTGLSDSMTPGSISDISQSSEPVFRVEFQGKVPPPAARYWRGLTYSDFDGESWRQAHTDVSPGEEDIEYADRPTRPWFEQLEAQRKGLQPDYRYRVLMEPSGNRWLFALDVPFSETPRVGLARDFRLVSRDPVDQAMAYRVASYPQLKMDVALPAWLRREDLALPKGGNPEARAMAQAWRADSASDVAYIQRLLAWFHEQPFYYTLHPPKLAGDDSIDAFLFQSRRGFCAHYASAFAFLMRAAGIPARVVAGYQGGEVNPMGSYLQVRQYDAHAWVEVWLQGQGWVREDPTAAVAPERIEDGILAALDEADAPAGAGALTLWNGSLLGRIGMFGDYMTYLWQRWVVNYDQHSQSALFANWFGKINFYQLLLWATSLVLSLALLVFAWLNWQARRQLPAWQWQYLRLRKALGRQGVEVTDGQTPKQLIIKACMALPEKRQQLLAWLAAYQSLAYAKCPPDEAEARLAQLKRRYPL